MDSDTVEESDLSLESRPFLHRVNDQARKRQKQSSKDATQDSDKHSVIWRNVFVFNDASIKIRGEELLRKITFHQKYRKGSRNETDARHI